MIIDHQELIKGIKEYFKDNPPVHIAIGNIGENTLVYCELMDLFSIL
jgi:hypothetical protein